ncbi:MAG TPA: uroporphyrinogen-III synthase [Chitinophagaceae bacterium]|nr:uroporphyrinogen-III synthase [Chitinophagaceae bacterium]
MVKNEVSRAGAAPVKSKKKILITQPRPESDKSPYFELSRKYAIELDFHPFIKLEPISAKDFRKQKIDIQAHSAVIFTSRNAIDHFFRMCEEMRISVSQDTKYFCITEAVALYLQKFILYRKRKVFYGADGTTKSLLDVINKHKGAEKFLYVCSENQQDSDITGWLRTNNCGYSLAFMYRTTSSDVKEVLTSNEYDVICFFTPSGVKSLFDNAPKFKQNGTVIGAFGLNTSKAIVEAGLQVGIVAPQPKTPSMVAALEQFLASQTKKD